MTKMIDVKDLHYTYPRRKERTIQGIDFSIEQGEIFGFLGPSGAGKSTIQKILIGILKNYSGHVQVLGHHIRSVNSDFYEQIGVAFEFPNFYAKFTALENLSFFRSLYSCETEEPAELLELVGLSESAKQKVSQFSKGMKMRLNFCRALLNKPEIIFLDEPTSGLDPINARNIKEMIRRKKAEGKTVIITTHNMNVAEEICDRVAFIVEGRILLINSPRELKMSKGQKKVCIEFSENNRIQSKVFDLTDLGTNQPFLSLLRSKEIQTIHTQEATLEDIFIEVTGRSLA